MRVSRWDGWRRFRDCPHTRTSLWGVYEGGVSRTKKRGVWWWYTPLKTLKEVFATLLTRSMRDGVLPGPVVSALTRPTTTTHPPKRTGDVRPRTKRTTRAVGSSFAIQWRPPKVRGGSTVALPRASLWHKGLCPRTYYRLKD